jgi:exopolyphosphatase/guanosine-5'-triphosphate,3'-diphosphate pyrophosphatase
MTATLRVACIDVGTNTVLVLVAERAPDDGQGGVRVIEDTASITRLGQGLDKSPRLHPEARGRTLAVLRAAGERARQAGARVLAVGTAALRRAEDGASFIAEAEQALGGRLEIISGEREANLSFHAVTGSFPELAGSALVVIDIGGGSTEIIVGDQGAVRSAVSHEIGSVRLTERCLASDPPSPAELDHLRREIATVFAAVAPAPGATVVGVAGTITTLLAVRDRVDPYVAEKVHGQLLSRAEVSRALAELAALPLETRRTLPGLEPKRADVIVAGAAILEGALERLGATELVVSDRGVRWGICYEALGIVGT